MTRWEYYLLNIGMRFMRMGGYTFITYALNPFDDRKVDTIAFSKDRAAFERHSTLANEFKVET